MIADFDDFCLWMYVIIADIWTQLAPHVYAARSGADVERQ